jgi:hypothetical protein
VLTWSALHHLPLDTIVVPIVPNQGRLPLRKSCVVTSRLLAVFFHFGNAIALSLNAPSLFAIQLAIHLGLPDF